MASTSGLLSNVGDDYVLPSSNSSKPYKYLIEVIGLDHCYAKPWSSQLRIPNPRPVKTLFLRDIELEGESSSSSNESKEDVGTSFVDVESVVDANSCGPNVMNMQYDVLKSKIAMGECEKYVSTVTSRRTPDTWEELICRTGWTNQQNVLFDKILKVVSSYRLARLTYEGSPNEPILRRVALDKATKKVRQILGRIEWDAKLTTWLHSSMADGLSIPLLACYLDIIQTLRSKVPTLVDKMTANPTSHRRASPGTADNMTSLLKRPWDATIGLSSFQRQRKVSGPPLLLIVPSGPTTNSTGVASKRSRFWTHHLSNLGKVVPVTMHLSNSGRGVSIGQCLDHMIGAVQAKVLELKNHYPNRPVVLIGWSTGALVSYQVSLVEPVCAVVCLGFPLLGLEGLRGEPEDPFLENKTPTMFVIGSLSSCCSLPDIEDFRSRLQADTSLLLIGGADDQLRLTCSKKKIEGVTQSMVDRRIMDEIGEFLGNAVSVLNSIHNRSDYFDFEEIDNCRKKPKAEKRKRPPSVSTEGTKKTKMTKAAKPATPRSQGNAPKKTKIAKNVKRPAANKPIVLASGTTLVPGHPLVRPTGLPLSKVTGTLPNIPGGLLQGVAVPLTGVVPVTSINVPVSGVNVPISRVSVPLSSVNLPVSGVNVPVSAVNVPVSAVIKQGSLGGRSFVFSCPPPTATNTGITSSVPSSTAPSSTGSAGNTQQLKIVINPPSSTVASGMTSPLTQQVQFKTGVASSPLSSKPGTSDARTATSTTMATVTTSAQPATSLVSASTTVSGSPQQNDQPLVTKTATDALTVSSSTVSTSATPPSGQVNPPKPMVATTTPIVRTAAPSTIYTSQMKPVQQAPRPTTTTATIGSGKQSAVRVDHAVSTHTATTARKPPPPQTTTRTIQVGVKDVKKNMVTKRTVSNTAPLQKGVNVVSRTSSSSVVAAFTGRTPPGNTVMNSALTTAQNKSVQQLIKQSMTTPALGVQSKNALHRASALVSASLASFRPANTTNAALLQAQKLSTQKASTASVSTKLGAQDKGKASLDALAQEARAISRYHDDQKLVEKIRGIVKDVVNSTPRTVKPGTKQHIVISTKSTTPSSQPVTSATTVTTAGGMTSQKSSSSDPVEQKETGEETDKKST